MCNNAEDLKEKNLTISCDFQRTPPSPWQRLLALRSGSVLKRKKLPRRRRRKRTSCGKKRKRRRERRRKRWRRGGKRCTRPNQCASTNRWSRKCPPNRSLWRAARSFPSGSTSEGQKQQNKTLRPCCFLDDLPIVMFYRRINFPNEHSISYLYFKEINDNFIIPFL